MKTLRIILICLLISLGAAAQRPLTAKDSTYAKIYIYLNWYDAIGYSFNLYFNDIPIEKIPNGSSLVYKMYSEGQIVLSDHLHQPHVTLTVTHGGRYYFRIRKYGPGRYFTVDQITGEDHINDYFTNGWIGAPNTATYFIKEDTLLNRIIPKKRNP